MVDTQTALINLIEEQKLWQALTSSPSWTKLVATLQEQADELQRAIVYLPLADANAIYLQEFRKGQLEGRLSITVTAETILSELDGEVQRLKDHIDDSGTSAEPSGRGRHGAP